MLVVPICMFFLYLLLIAAHAFIETCILPLHVLGLRQEPSDATYLSAALLIVILKQRAINKSIGEEVPLNTNSTLTSVGSEFKKSWNKIFRIIL